MFITARVRCPATAAPTVSTNVLEWLTGPPPHRTTTHERLDFVLQYKVPNHWDVRPVVRENFLLVRAMPTGSDLEGLSINAFAYHKRVATADSMALLQRFLTQFQSSMHESMIVSPPAPAEDLNSVSTASIDFISKSNPVKARGVITAFFHPNHRYHYVCVFATRREIWGKGQSHTVDAFANDILRGVSCMTTQ